MITTGGTMLMRDGSVVTFSALQLWIAQTLMVQDRSWQGYPAREMPIIGPHVRMDSMLIG